MLRYAICPICKKEVATGGTTAFRCCRHEFLIEANKTAYSDIIARKVKPILPEVKKSKNQPESEEKSLNTLDPNSKLQIDD